ncbi:hypothetical protein FK529_12795 [Tsukamurella asaccharolytica]|uniref:CopG family transcriptional regulator n=1 Tax=Tsukamurella asaccharolytica TaxID=2592067 RepID=A0A5C5R7B2_9ACTN|nr:hypothetical protein [Tsukamurella asaccharolytica]TWS18860.1 hypothetical protein FK529_12795 [Tsukamurella asaccharolytica]
MTAHLEEFRDAPLRMTSLRAPEGLFDRAREELGYASNQDMVVSLVERALLQSLQRRMIRDLAGSDGSVGLLADPEFLAEARR